MEILQGNLLESLRGIQQFLDEHADVLGAISKSGARQDLDAQVADLTAHAVAQDGSHLDSKNATLTQYALRRDVLRDHMAPIARVAAATLSPGPALAALKMPPHKRTTAQLYAAALGLANSAEPFSAVFIAKGLPEDFIAQLRTAAAALLVPIDVRTRSRSVRKGATASLSDQASKARKNVHVLDALVRRVLKNDADLLNRWNGVKRPPSKASKGGGAAPATPAPTAPVPVSPPLQLAA